MADDILITGGAGFIGVNTAAHYLRHGHRVVLYDNFSRKGTHENLEWLRGQFAGNLVVIEGDITRQDDRLAAEVERARVVFHLAAQVAVTTSVTDPRADFETNALGTFNVLEAVRRSTARPAVIYASTNKVYGKMADVAVADRGTRYAYGDRPDGIGEDYPLEFYSPYGCSKGAGDQYVMDYARIYGLRTVVFRQSCIYGPNQFGMEDQGWVAWFSIRAVQGRKVTIFGDGKQVRDVLWAEDLVSAYDAALKHMDRISGRAYNIGGGPDFTMSLLELVALLDRKLGRPLQHGFADWRPGDQKVFVSDIRRARADFGWEPRVTPAEGVDRLVDWITRNRTLVDRVAS